MKDNIIYQHFPLKKGYLNDVDLYKLMGYKGHKPEESILKLIEELWNSLKDLCVPYAGYCILKGGKHGQNEVIVNDLVLQTGPVIAEAMGEASEIAIFTATLGVGYDVWMEQIKSEDNILNEFIANSMATVIIESITEELIALLKHSVAGQELTITNNYSPGYCGWSLFEQRKLFSLLPNDVSGITLTESCLMLPIKSVSGIIGVGKNVIKRPYRCAVCDMRTRCHYSK